MFNERDSLASWYKLTKICWHAVKIYKSTREKLLQVQAKLLNIKFLRLTLSFFLLSNFTCFASINIKERKATFSVY